jgi:pyruvate/2-oxoacid:ferredoxin oxidoreductase beta subunit
MSVRIARLAVQTGVFPLYEVENGQHYTINYLPEHDRVEEYFKKQGRFRQLQEEDLQRIREMVAEEWNLLRLKTDRSRSVIPIHSRQG